MDISKLYAAFNQDIIKAKIVYNLMFGPLPIVSLLGHLQNCIEIKPLYAQLDSLKVRGLVVSQSYTDNHGVKHALYGVDDPGAGILIAALDIEIEHIRKDFPGINGLPHHLTVTDVFRAIIEQSEVIPYHVECRDENQLRHLAARLKKNKKYFPDLFINLEYIHHQPNKRRFYNIEIDRDTVWKVDIAHKLLYFKMPTLMICSTNKRIEDLRAYLSSYKDLYDNVAFTTESEFCRKTGGVVGTNWISIDGRKAITYPR